MMRETGCDGVVVGRGCLGRPWLFGDLAAVFAGRQPENPPNFGAVARVMLEHASLLCDWLGEGGGMRSFRKQSTWYTKGFPDSSRIRSRLIQVERLSELEEILAEANPSTAFPEGAMRLPRGKSGASQSVALPMGFLDDLEDATPPPPEADALFSGG
jgi:tRNA-dihydrouridine synthase